MKKPLALVALVAFLLMGCPPPTSPPASLTVHFKKQALWGPGINVYAWYTQGSLNFDISSKWPGNPMAYEGNGWYSAVITGSQTPKLIFNDGAFQTADLNRDRDGWFDGTQWWDSAPESLKPSVNTPGILKITEVGGHYYSNTPSWFEVINLSTTESAQISRYKLRSYYMNNSGSYFTSPQLFSFSDLVIPPGGYALVTSPYGEISAAGGQTAQVISLGTVTPYWNDQWGHVELTLDGTTADALRYGDDPVQNLSGGWTGVPSPAFPALSTAVEYGTAYSRDQNNGDGDTKADWNITSWATPGGPNDVPASAVDGDEDGIPDSSEAVGGTFAGLPLNLWGAAPGKRDIFIHVDFMDQSDRAIADEGITPRKEALQKVVDAFSLRNIAVHFDTGDLYTKFQLVKSGETPPSHRVPFSLGLTLGQVRGTANLYTYKNLYMPLDRRQIFHYLIMGNTQNSDGSAGSSGLGEVKGNDFLVTLGAWGLSSSGTMTYDALEKTNELINLQASTIMHELGHNLGLLHGGSEDTNFKPNYLSVMNYLYQLSGLPTIGVQEGDRFHWNQYRPPKTGFKALQGFVDYYSLFTAYTAVVKNSEYTADFSLDYSPGLALDLMEASLDETKGLRMAASAGVDFNGDKDSLDIALGVTDLNGDQSKTTLQDFDDWGNLTLDFQRKFYGDANGTSRTLLSPKLPLVIDDVQPYATEYDQPRRRN